VLKSLPDELARFASQTLTSARHVGHPLDTDTLINSVIKESERLKNQHTRGQQGQGKKQREGNTDEALAATGSEGGRRKCCPGNCHNCGKPGHWACECRKPKKKSENGKSSNMPQGNSNAPQANTNTPAKSENKPVGLANTVVEHDFEGDGFWMAEEVDMTPALTIGADLDPCIGNPDDSEEGPQDLELNFT